MVLHRLAWILMLIWGVILVAYNVPAYVNTKSKLCIVQIVIGSLLIILESVALILG